MKYILLLLLCAQTTVPTHQIEVQHNGKAIKIIVTEEVAGRVANGSLTQVDRDAVAVAIELELGHVPFHTSNPCHKPDAGGPHLHDSGREVSNCSESQGVK
jgi:vacuolar-type H+-ATPase subunit B/Vma2